MPPAKASVLEGVASLVRIKVNADAPLDTGYRKVIVALSVRVAVNTPPLTTSKFIAVPVLPKATTVSA